MAYIKRVGKLIWRGDLGSSAWDNESFSHLPAFVGGTPLITFATAIEPYSLCNLNYYLSIQSWSQSVGAPAAAANIDKKGIIYFRDPADLLVKTFCYPDPIAADIEVTPWGKKIKDSAVTAIVALLSTMTGLSYEPMYGVYYQRQ